MFWEGPLIEPWGLRTPRDLSDARPRAYVHIREAAYLLYFREHLRGTAGAFFFRLLMGISDIGVCEYGEWGS